MLKGSKHLRIAGILEIIIGAAMLIFTWMLVGEGDFSEVLKDNAAGSVFISILVLYGFHIFEILTGIVGVARANKKSYLALILGIIIFAANLWKFFAYDDQTVTQILIHALTLVVPYYYLHNAFRNIRS